jgi:uncharacterized protein YaaR (DUF327 family)
MRNIHPNQSSPIRKKRGNLVVLVVFIAVLAGVWTQRIAIQDDIKLYNYHPDAVVRALASQTTMTPFGRHLFYVNHPQIRESASFNISCQAHSEKTIGLGCYHNNQAGIFLYHVTDSRLDGVEQVTAAHEMLHAAYDRLNAADKKQVNGWLMDYYQNGLQDQRIKDTIAAYKQSEPTEVVNEMHSVFGTEATKLPPQLENYYKRYFTDRNIVLAEGQRYQQEFTSRENAVAQDDSSLKSYKQQIDTNNSRLAAMQAEIKQKQSKLDQERNSSDIAAYNAGVPDFNAEIDSYNSLAAATSQLINEYNDLVKVRNSLAGEVNQLAQAISSQPPSTVDSK